MRHVSSHRCGTIRWACCADARPLQPLGGRLFCVELMVRVVHWQAASCDQNEISCYDTHRRGTVEL